MTTTIDPVQFVSSVRPLLEKQNVTGLVTLLKSNWTCEQIAALMMGDDEDARKVAACCLALVGKRCTVEKLAEQLKNPDPTVNQMAEHALWSIWFRCGTPQANTEVCRGTKALNRREFEKAIEHFNRAIELEDDFAEAFNQRAIAHYFQERWQASIDDCREAIKRMPCHFGAWSGMGNCYMHLGRLNESLKCYEKALAINPHLDCLRQTVTEIKNQSGPSVDYCSEDPEVI
jgi:tetratricopeptide (TPR) repeat protein